MKYIRTENKIIKAKKNKWNELVDKQGKYISELEIIAQADTIEELCDEFVAIKKSTEYTTILRKTFPFEDKDKTINKCSLKSMSGWIDDFKNWNKEYIIYGAIWTDKGLIYVAKMNSKGELELI